MFSEVFNCVKNFTFLLYRAHETEQLKKRADSLATSYDLVENIFLNELLITNSSDLICDLFIGQAGVRNTDWVDI